MKESQFEQGNHTNKVSEHEELVQNAQCHPTMLLQSQFPAVKAATSSVLPDTKRMRSEASVVLAEEKAAFKRRVKEEK